MTRYHSTRPRNIRHGAICLTVGILFLLTTVGLANEEKKTSPPVWRIDPGETSTAPQFPWRPELPLSHYMPAREDPLAPAEKTWTLGELIDFALRHNPDTRAAWHAARAAAAVRAAAGSAFLPQADLGGTATGGYGSTGAKNETWYGSIGPELSVTYLLYDGGGREAGLEEARQALLAANWVHRAVLQDVMLEVLQNYYIYQGTRVLVASQESAVKEARTVLDAAKERHDAGVATIADVLQAEASLAQVQLVLQEVTRDLRIREGVMATAVGLPANANLRIAEFQPDFPIDSAARDVDRLIAEACQSRPDLAAAAARLRKSTARIRRVEAEGRPYIAVNGIFGAQYNSRWDTLLDTYSVGLSLRFPLFTGYAQAHNETQAREEAAVSREEYASLRQSAMLEVWSSYYTLQAAGQKIRTSEQLLRSATQSYEVALGRYRAGVGDILDLLSTQKTLETARAEQVRARTEWLVALAGLSRDTGRILDDPAMRQGIMSTPTGPSNEQER
ncbi:MAG: TolC family protein [Acidobacteria bacterium]|nr:TolC family protein [Acidobacteriota bacterium]